MVTLSGGDLGGTQIQWVPNGKKADGREYMEIDGYIYLRSGDIAVYDGLK